MDERIVALLANETVRRGLRQAWLDSNPGVLSGHEEGGFICLSADGNGYVIDSWESGIKNEINCPSHPGGKRNNEWIVATFHTHPNTGKSYDHEPSAADIDLVKNDAELKTVYYQGEFVISGTKIYVILPTGKYIPIHDTQDYFR